MSDRIINIPGGTYVESNTGTINIHGNNINTSQDLADVAAQIQKSIEELQKQGVTADVAQEEVATAIATQAKTDSKLKENLQKWAQSIGEATVSDVIKGIIKLAIRKAGIPLP